MSKHKIRRVLVQIPVVLLCGVLAAPAFAAPAGGDLLASGLLARAWQALADLVPGLSGPQTGPEALRAQAGPDEQGPGVDPIGEKQVAPPLDRSPGQGRSLFILEGTRSGSPAKP